MSWGTEDHKHTAYDVYGVAEEHHRHYDLEDSAEGLRADLRRAEARIGDLEGALAEATGRIAALEAQTPQARQLQLEADLAAADLAESGYGPADEALSAECRDRRHARCPAGVACDCCCHADEDQADEPEPAEHDPDPEVDDEGGWSEYRYAITTEEPW
jgi:hypothetical protein